MPKIIDSKDVARNTLTLKKENSAQATESQGRQRFGEVGYSGLNAVSGRIIEEARHDLRFPQAVKTFKKMAQDPTIKSANNVIDMAIGQVDWEFRVPKNNQSAEVENAVDFLNFCMNNMEGQDWNDFINQVGDYRTYGYSLAEKVYTRTKRGKYKGKVKWKKLAPRSQESVHKWLWDDTGRRITGVEQSVGHLNSEFRAKAKTTDHIQIPYKKLLHFRYDPKKDNPEGSSPLLGCYIPWNYKKIIEEYEGIGVAKDLGGVPVIGIPVDFLNKAAADPNSNEAQIVEQLQKNASSLHAGDKTYIIQPIAYNDQGKELFSTKLIGVDGGGKQYSTDEIIKRKQNEILMVYMADVLKLGSDSHGSFALADTKNNLLTLAIKHHLELIKRVIMRDLIPQTLALNGWSFEDEDMPELHYGEIEERDLEPLGKFIQRVASVGALEVDQDLSDSLRDVASLPETNREKPMEDKFLPASNSKAGEGKGTSGTGTSQTSGDGNLDNK